MKKTIILILFIFSIPEILPQKDYSNFRTFYGVQVNTGMTFFIMDPIKEDFNNIVNAFRKTYNIPLPVQHLYPADILWGATFFWYTSRGWSVAFNVDYTGSKAYSMYEDYAGTLDIKGEISDTYIGLGFKRHFDDVEIIQPLIGLNLGIALYEYKTLVNLNIGNGEHRENQNFAFSDLGFTAEICAGFTYDIDFALFEFAVGYRYLRPMPNYEFFEQQNFNIKLGLKKGIFK